MTVREQLIKELEGLPLKAQKKIMKMIHLMKHEFLVSVRRKRGKSGVHALIEVDEIAVEIGISDLASQHDHYLYGCA